MERLLLELLPGISKAIRQSRRDLLAACHSRRPVILAGELGTGKGYSARAIHRMTCGAGDPFHLLGQADVKAGGLPADGGGTWFLDWGEWTPRGPRTGLGRLAGKLPPAARLVISLTLGPRQEFPDPCLPLPAGHYSLVRLPPLRQRREDLPLLLASLCREHEPGSSLALSPSDVDYLYTHPWPGNLKELLAWLEGRVVPPRTAGRDGQAGRQTLGRLLDREIELWVDAMMEGTPRDGLMRKISDRLERSLLVAVLSRTQGNQIEAAAILGINRNTLARKISDHGLSARTRRRAGPRRPRG